MLYSLVSHCISPFSPAPGSGVDAWVSTRMQCPVKFLRVFQAICLRRCAPMANILQLFLSCLCHHLHAWLCLDGQSYGCGGEDMPIRAEGCTTMLRTIKSTFFLSGGKLGIQGLLKMGVFAYISKSS